MTLVGKPIKCRAAVCWEKNQAPVIEEIEVAPPKAGEVRIKVLYNALCHSDVHAMDGVMEVKFPIILGHEAAGIVESVGEGVTGFAAGDHVIPLYVPQCRSCVHCKRPDSNACTDLNLLAMAGPMADGTCRFTCKGQEINHFMGTSTFAEYTVVTESRVAKINPKADLSKACVIGCGISTGYGAAINTAQVQPGESVCVWGLGAVGLSAVMGAKVAGAEKIVVVDMNPAKFDKAKELGATHFIDPNECPEGKPFMMWMLEQFGFFDKTIECIGNVTCMRQAIELVTKGWGIATIIGISPAGQELSFIPFHLIVGKKVTGSMFGGWKSADDVPRLVEDMMEGKLNVDALITHRFELEGLGEALDLLKSGKSLRSVITLAKAPEN